MTGDKVVSIYSKKIMPYDQFSTNFLTYLVQAQLQGFSKTFRAPCIFDAAVAITPGGNNGVNYGAGWYATNGKGLLVKSPGTFFPAKIPAGSAVYHLGIEQNFVPSGIEINTRTGQPFYKTLVEEIGRRGVPSSVVDNGDGTITLTVDSVTEHGIDYTGHHIKVLLKSRVPDYGETAGIGPLALNEGEAIIIAAITFSGGFNKITVGALGQTSISVTPSDYVIYFYGPTVVRKVTEDLRTSPNVVFLAEITSVNTGLPIPGGNISIVDQVVTVFSGTDFGQVLRKDTHGTIKIDVRADASDSAEAQIRVRNNASTVVFSIDEAGTGYFKGNVQIDGNLVVSGTEQVTLTETVLGDVQIGNANTDALQIYSTTTLRADTRMLPAATLYLGDSSTATTPGIVFDSNGPDYTCQALNGNDTLSNTTHIYITRTDANSNETALIIKQYGAGGKMSLRVQKYIDVGMGEAALTPQLRFFGPGHATNPFLITGDTDSLTLDATHSGGAATVYIKNTGGGGATADINVQNDAYLGGVLRRNTGTLQFRDQNTGANVDFSAATPANSIDPGRQSILGALYEHARGFDECAPGGIRWATSSDLKLIAGSGLNATIGSGIAWVNGRRQERGSGLAVVLTNSQTAYLYLDGTNTGATWTQASTTSAYATAFSPGNIVLAKAITAGGAISSITDLRRFRRRTSDTVTVGADTTNNTPGIADFQDLATAVAWCRELYNSGTLATPLPEIVLCGALSVPAAVDIDFPATIRSTTGALNTSGQEVSWAYNGPLFNLKTGASGARFIGIRARYELAGVQNLSSFITLVAGQTVANVSIDGCYIDSISGTTDNINKIIDISGTATQLAVTKNRFYNGLVGISISANATGVDVNGNTVERNATATSTTAISSAGVRVVIASNRLGKHQYGVQLLTNDSVEVVGNYIWGMLDSAVTDSVGALITGNVCVDCLAADPGTVRGVIHSDTGPSHIIGNKINNHAYRYGIYVNATNTVVKGNHYYTTATTTAVTGAIFVSQNECLVEGNHIRFTSACPGVFGINFTAQGGICSNNYLSGVGTNANVGNAIVVLDYTTVTGNKIKTTNGSAIKVDGARCVISGNIIDVISNPSGGNGAIITTTNCIGSVISSNTISHLTTTDPIRIPASSNNNIVQLNVYTGVISNSGTSNLVDPNTVINNNQAL